MLILSRKTGESLYIGNDVKITIVEVKGGQVRIGLKAPKKLKIYREEIYLQIKQENEQALGFSPDLKAIESMSKKFLNFEMNTKGVKHKSLVAKPIQSIDKTNCEKEES